MEDFRASWKVLLIGGCSGIGKTYLAEKLSDYYKCPYIRLDHIRFIIQKLLENDKEQYKLFFSDIDPISKSSYPKKAEFLKPALKAYINKLSKHKETPEMIIEGIELFPEILDIKQTNDVKGIFLYDTEENLKTRMLGRGRTSDNKDIDSKVRAHTSLGDTIRTQAKNNGFFTLQASPEDTTVDRAIKLLG